MAHSLESVRVIWSSTDEEFFRSTADLFDPAFLWGAGTLLASYDQDTGWETPQPSVRTRAAASAAPGAVPLRRTAA